MPVGRPHQSSAGDRHAGSDLLRKLRKLADLALVPAYRAALVKGVAAAVEHAAIPYRSDIQTVIDVGAHRGQFATFALRAFPEAQIFCFEPLPGSVSRLRAATATPRVTVFETALGSERRTGTFHVSRSSDSSSLLAIGARYVAAFPGTDEATTAEVEIHRLDEVLRADQIRGPALLKLDVQGSELDVIDGSRKLLPQIQQIVAEVSFTELYSGQPLAGRVVATLYELGFQLTGVFQVKRDRLGRCLQSDFLFERAEER